MIVFFWCCFFNFLNSRNEQHNPPPSYFDGTESLSTISSESTLAATDRYSTTPNIKPSNFISLSRSNESIKGSWLIDPTLSIPSFFLPPPPTEGARSNLFLESKNGAIDADIYLLPTSRSDKNISKFIVIHTQSNNGSVKTRLVSLTESFFSGRLFINDGNTSFYSTIRNRWMAKFVLPLDFQPARQTDPYTFSFHVHSVAQFESSPSTAALTSQQPSKPISHLSPSWITYSVVFWVISIHRSGILGCLGRAMSFRLNRRMGVYMFLMMMKDGDRVVDRSFRSFFLICRCKSFVRNVLLYIVLH